MQRIAYAYPKKIQTLTAEIDISPLKAIASKEKTALVVINDATRPTPTSSMLSAIKDVLKCFKSFKIIVATGSHRIPSEDEYKSLLGSLYSDLREYCIAHDCHDLSNVDLGVTKYGTPVIVDAEVLSSDVLILTGSVEPHYFAGFTGGRKAIFPGLAGFECIKANHRLALSEKAKTLGLKDNPVHLDMLECLAALPEKEVFSIMTVLSETHDILYCATGSIDESFKKCVDVAEKAFCPTVEAFADIVITTAKSPTDINLYQAQKAMDNAFKALAEGGAIILIAKCPDGLGGKAFADLLASCSSAEQVTEKISKHYELGYHKSAKMAYVLSKAKVFCISDLSQEDLSKVFMTKAASLPEAIRMAEEYVKQENPRILYLPDGTLTVPMIDEVNAEVKYEPR